MKKTCLAYLASSVLLLTGCFGKRPDPKSINITIPHVQVNNSFKKVMSDNSTVSIPDAVVVFKIACANSIVSGMPITTIPASSFTGPTSVTFVSGGDVTLKRNQFCLVIPVSVSSPANAAFALSEAQLATAFSSGAPLSYNKTGLNAKRIFQTGTLGDYFEVSLEGVLDGSAVNQVPLSFSVTRVSRKVTTGAGPHVRVATITPSMIVSASQTAYQGFRVSDISYLDDPTSEVAEDVSISFRCTDGGVMSFSTMGTDNYECIVPNSDSRTSFQDLRIGLIHSTEWTALTTAQFSPLNHAAYDTLYSIADGFKLEDAIYALSISTFSPILPLVNLDWSTRFSYLFGMAPKPFVYDNETSQPLPLTRPDLVYNEVLQTLTATGRIRLTSLRSSAKPPLSFMSGATISAARGVVLLDDTRSLSASPAAYGFQDLTPPTTP